MRRYNKVRATQPAEKILEKDDLAPGFGSIVATTATKEKMVSEEQAHVASVQADRMLDNEFTALSKADDRLKASVAEYEKANALLAQRG